MAIVSAAPLEPHPENSSNENSHIQSLLMRPSPINPDIPMDPKPPERIILADNNSEMELKSLHDNDGYNFNEDFKSVNDFKEEKKDIRHKQDENSNEKSNDHQSDHDYKRETDVKSDVKPANSKLKPKEEPIKSDQPTIVYATKADEKRSATDSFETSHRIPQVDESERTFETSHHIPTHIEDERTKVVENAKVGQKPLNH